MYFELEIALQMYRKSKRRQGKKVQLHLRYRLQISWYYKELGNIVDLEYRMQSFAMHKPKVSPKHLPYSHILG